MDSINRQKLDELLSRSGVMKGSEWRQRLEDLQRLRESGVYEIDTAVPGTLVGDEKSGFYLVSHTYPWHTPHGAVTLDSVLEARGEHIALSASDDELIEFNPRTAFFIDTETTGLSGGTGTVAFLVGIAYFVEEGLRLDQCFMRDYDDEEPMLQYLDEVMKPCETVVSYNGKTFDMPLLRTRFIQNRIRFRMDGALHFDLLHAARRFFKRRLGNCSLGNVEREVLGLERHGDVPGHEIPQLWFDYLRTRDARRLAPVFYHHRMDILSLVALTGWLSRCLGEPDGRGFEHNDDRFSLLRVCLKQKKYSDVVAHGDRLLEIETDPDRRVGCLELIAHAAKRLGDFDRVENSLSLILQEQPSNLWVRLELAKHYEHKTRNYAEAERLCQQAVEYLETREALGRATEFEQAPLEAFRRRLTRIRGKMLPSRRAGVHRKTREIEQEEL
ncbi:MAG: ribonuclease H-like domain-containing protein [Candidatus Hydrogenedentes bacterium]|nr:ribonuclease H-like domain-containing protein [Candidatus Hydrogenedentota bacterium]